MSYLRPGTWSGQLLGFVGTPPTWQGGLPLSLPDQGTAIIGQFNLGAAAMNFDYRMSVMRRGTTVQAYAELASSGWTATTPNSNTATGVMPVGLRPAFISSRSLAIQNGAAAMLIDFYPNGNITFNRPATVISSPVGGRGLIVWSTI